MKRSVKWSKAVAGVLGALGLTWVCAVHQPAAHNTAGLTWTHNSVHQTAVHPDGLTWTRQ